MAATSPAFAALVERHRRDRIAEITAFHEPGLLAAFGLPAEHR